MDKDKDKYDHIQQELKKMEEEQWHSFLPKAAEIQEALKPLGYVVEGFYEKTSRNFVIHLFLAQKFVCINGGNVIEQDLSDSSALDES